MTDDEARTVRRAGPPQASTAPSGGSALREARSVGVALFDLDHTLLPIDSDHSWGVFTTRIGWTDPVAFAQRNDAFYAQYQAGTLDIHDYVRFATEAVRLQGREAALQARAQFMREVVGPAIRAEAQKWGRLVREKNITAE